MAFIRKTLQLLLLSTALLNGPVLGLSARAAFSSSSADVNSGNTLSQLSQSAYDSSMNQVKAASKKRASTCNLSNVKIRREWRTLSVKDRKAFIAAVKCVRSSPSLFPPGAVPGSKSLYDDFIAVHINQTLFIHLTGTFLTWHRYYTWVYEQKINACGYTGSFPYWEWGLDANNVNASPVFDGSDTSLGGNGAYFPHQGIQISFPGFPGPLYLPPGNGGGCVTTGPFNPLTIRLGPVAVPQYGSPNSTGPPTGNPLDDNLRCLKRDLNTGVAKQYTSFKNSTDLVLGTPNIEQFQAIMQGDPRYVTNQLGVHGGGHFTMGGDPGSDPFVSPGDPAFYLHHAQVDRLYWIWQRLDFPHRKNVFGSHVFLDIFPSSNVTVNDLIDITPLSSQTPQIKDLMDTVGGTPLCYVYL